MTFVFVLWTMTLPGCGREISARPPLLILDTDFSSDADDVGAAAVLHNLAAQGKVNILAMMVSSGNPWSVPCLQAVNAWFGRPEIPVGKAADGAVQDESAYTRAVAEAFSRRPAAAPDAVQLYRRTLAAQPDQSVTVVSVGYLTNLRNLLQSKPDAVSPLDGQELVRRKTARLVCMGGQYPSGREWNFHRDAEAAAYVAAHWPTPIIFAGFELGKDIVTGAALRRLPENNPIRRSYELHNKLAGRPSWDQIAVYYAVMTANGEQIPFWSKIHGSNAVSEDGSNRWLNEKNGRHAYLVQRGDSAKIAARLEQLMLP
ncbi:nucleoside hydrolase [Candidatus Electronema sp. JM]|uniref:nucleoside hydrolase n=1 Tax=Candidatus Electronema sp. JM TaxID=3401571 RepID=UPI003AA98B57